MIGPMIPLALRLRLVVAGSLLAFGDLGAPRAAAAVTVYDDRRQPAVRLAPLQPMPEAVRAILAYYAMRASSGCANQAEGGALQCELTKALGFASQCAPAQLELVGTWFRDGAPPLHLSAGPVKAADLALVCNAVPDTATQRSQWETLRLDRVGDQIEIHAVLAWTAGPDGPSGRVSIETRYLVLKDRVTVLKHAERAER